MALSMTAAQDAGSAHASDQGAQAPAVPDKESPSMTHPPEASRPAPPLVPPVFHKGIRYEQDMESTQHGGDPFGGYLAAIDAATGARLWILKIYQVMPQNVPGLPTLDRFFKRMSLVPDRDELSIEDEAGGRYLVDLARRSVTVVYQAPAVSEPIDERPMPTPE